MPKYFHKRVLNVVSEVTPGTDPGSGYTAILADVGAVASPSAVTTPRNVTRDSFSKLAPVVSQRQWTLPIEVELAGGGISGTLQKPPIAPLLIAAGMEETAGLIVTIDNPSGTFQVGELVEETVSGDDVGYVLSATATELVVYNATTTPSDDEELTGADSGATADTDTSATAVADAWVYRPISDRDSAKPATIHAYLDGLRSVMTYGRSTIQLAFQHPNKPMATLSVQGIYSTPTEVANPAATYSTVEAPDCFPATIAFGGTTLTDIAIEGMTFDTGNQVVTRPDIKAADALIGFEISNRDGATVSFDPELADTLSNLNAFSLWTGRTENATSIKVGSTLGNRIWVFAPSAVIDEVSINDRNAIAAYGITAGLYEANQDAEDSELFLVFS